ncbi:MAG: 5'-nucleotidase C-terminal domain-containing protein [Deltaproteobacteria bacterium]|nr:5'-nucleotidase C-terminal domain-containing protein [Deltaproteobacteria bacterium]
MMRSSVVAAGLVVLAACGSASTAARDDHGAPRHAEGGAGVSKPEDKKPAADARPAGETAVSRNLVAVDDSVPAAPDLAQKLVGPRLAVEKEMHEVLGQSARALTRRRPDGPDGLMGNLLADVMRTAAAESTGKPVDVAFTNKGGVRGDLPKGPLTRGDILEVMPFDNGIVVLEISGAELQEVLDRSSTHGGDPWSGVSFRIVDRKAVDVKVGDAPLDLARTYRLCTNDYIVDGGGRYEALKRAKNVNRTGILIRDALLAHVQRETEAGRLVDSTVGGRILSVDAPPEAKPE